MSEEQQVKKTPEERQAERRDQLEMLLIREGMSALVMLAVLVFMSPKVQIWLRAQAGRFTARQSAFRAHEAAMLALLRQELSRDLPAVEHGLVDP
jgi:hypothetical protein